MEEKTTCPVCGKAGIDNYHDSEEPKCPNCGSDLRVFKLLDELKAERASNRNIWKPIAIIAILAAVLFALYSASAGSSAADKKQLAMLNDSIKSLQEKINDLTYRLDPSKPAPVTTTTASQQAEQAKTADAQEKKTDEGKTEKAAPTGKKYYVIKKGDTLSKISKEVYGSGDHVKEIAKLNGISENKVLTVGDSLLVAQ